MKRRILRIMILGAVLSAFTLSALAQSDNGSKTKVTGTTAQPAPTPAAKPKPQVKSAATTTNQTAAATPAPTPAEIITKTDTTGVQSGGQSEATSEEEKEILPYYKNYLDRYTLGPTDVISVEVFGQCPNYCKTGITVPPDGRIQYPLIRGGVFVAGRTIQSVTNEITKKLDEYIIDPQVTITIDKAMSSRYSVLGQVASPGVRVMERRVTLWEALVEAGGITKEGNKSKVMLYRYGPTGNLLAETINLESMRNGKSAMIELRPGDQIFVPSTRSDLRMIFSILEKASLVRFLFGVPF